MDKYKVKIPYKSALRLRFFDPIWPGSPITSDIEDEISLELRKKTVNKKYVCLELSKVAIEYIIESLNNWADTLQYEHDKNYSEINAYRRDAKALKKVIE